MTKWKPFSKRLPLTEFLEDDSVGEALSTDTDAFKDTITPELFQDQGRINLSTLKRRMGRMMHTRTAKLISKELSTIANTGDRENHLIM